MVVRDTLPVTNHGRRLAISSLKQAQSWRLVRTTASTAAAASPKHPLEIPTHCGSICADKYEQVQLMSPMMNAM